MVTRRQFLTGLGLAATAGTCLAVGGDESKAGLSTEGLDRIPDGSASRGMVTDRTEQAISRGLAFLNAQRASNGSFGTGAYRGNVAVTSLAGMAFMCAGHQPGRGAHGKLVHDALRYVVSKENVSGGQRGFLHNPSGSPHGPMYGHGFATLFLAEAYGMAHDRALREELRGKLKRATELILSAQKANWEGAWRYHPTSTDADLSVTICQIMALRSARNAGIDVPKSAVDKCTEYVRECQDRMEGWFRYMKRGGGGGGAQGFARTAAGVCAFNAAGIYRQSKDKDGKLTDDALRVEAGLNFLLKNKPGSGYGRSDMHYFYGHYYAVQAMWTAGGHYWQEWYPAIRNELLARQINDRSSLNDGSWQDMICSHYATAMACIILQVPNNYLPILQK